MGGLSKFLGYAAASLGVVFLIIAVFARLYSIREPSVKGEIFTYPYQFLAVPYFLIGIVFLIGGISGFWVDYLRFERNRETAGKLNVRKDQPEPRTETQPLLRQDFQAKTPLTEANSQSRPAEVNRVDEQIGINSRKLGLIVVLFGAILLFVAAFAYSYQQTNTTTIPGISVGGMTVTPPYSYDVTTNPYRDYTFPLILGGVALFVIGIALMIYKAR